MAPRERDRQATTVSVKVSTKVSQVTRTRNADIVEVGLRMHWVGTAGESINNTPRRYLRASSHRFRVSNRGRVTGSNESRFPSPWTPSPARSSWEISSSSKSLRMAITLAA